MLVEGRGTLTVSREWKSGEDVVKAQPPFLSYNELGSLLDEGPSKLYDALSSVLGLEELLDVQGVLADARKIRQDQVKRTKQAAEAIRTRIASLPDAGTDSRLGPRESASAGRVVGCRRDSRSHSR